MCARLCPHGCGTASPLEHEDVRGITNLYGGKPRYSAAPSTCRFAPVQPPVTSAAIERATDGASCVQAPDAQTTASRYLIDPTYGPNRKDWTTPEPGHLCVSIFASDQLGQYSTPVFLELDN